MLMLGQLALDLVGDAADPVAAHHVQAGEMGDDGIARLGIEFGESQVFQLLAHILHADAPGQRRIDIDRLLGDAPALVGLLDVTQGAHIVQPVGQLDQKHADVAGHGQHQLAEILGLLGAFGEKFQLGEFGDAVHQIGDLLAEILLDVVIGDQRVLDRVVQQRGDDGGHVELELGQDGRHFQGMGEIGIARGAELLAMRRHGIDIGLVEQRLVGVRVIGLDPLHQFGLAHQLAPAGLAGLSPKAAATAAACPAALCRRAGSESLIVPTNIGVLRNAINGTEAPTTGLRARSCSRRSSKVQNSPPEAVRLLFVVGFRLGLRLGAALGFAGQRAQQLLFRHLAMRGILAVVGLGPRLFRLVHFRMLLQASGYILP